MTTEEMELQQVSFHQAVYDDTEMSAELKLYWLKACADQYLEQLEVSERSVNILRGGVQVIEELCARGEHDMVAVSCGVALRATNPKRGHAGLEQPSTQTTVEDGASQGSEYLSQSSDSK